MPDKKITQNQDKLKSQADASFHKKNPYTLVFYRSDWSEGKTRRNNTKYWEWEIKHNGLRLP